MAVQLRIFTIGTILALAGCGEPPPAASPIAVSPSAALSPRAPSSRSATPPAGGSAPDASAASVASAGDSGGRSEPALPPVELVPATPAEAPDRLPSLSILAPVKNQVIPSTKAGAFEVKLGVRDWDLAPAGNHLCVRLDKHPCRRVTDLKKPLTLGEIDPTLDDGQHVLTVFARRGSGESLKPAGKRAAFASLSFFVGKKVPPVWKDGGPMLFFDPPADGPAPPEGVLIDFYVAHAEIARGKHVVHASVGGPGLGIGTAVVLDSPAPLRLHNPRPGEYLVRLSLFGYQAELGPSGSSTTVSYTSAPVPGPFAEVTRSFRVTPANQKR